MKAPIAAVMAMLVLFGLFSCSAAELCPSTERNLEWSSSCFQGTASARRVKPEYTAKIVTTEAGYATIMISNPRELVAVDRNGAVAIPNIFHTGDFDYPNANAGLGRFQRHANGSKGESSAKCGYFDMQTFKVAIPAVYEHCQAFQQGVAIVCNGCASYCTEPECQSSILIGGEGFAIDSKNRILRQFAPPPLTEACGGRAPAEVQKVGTLSYLTCPSDAKSPFGKLK